MFASLEPYVMVPSYSLLFFVAAVALGELNVSPRFTLYVVSVPNESSVICFFMLSVYDAVLSFQFSLPVKLAVMVVSPAERIVISPLAFIVATFSFIEE